MNMIKESKELKEYILNEVDTIADAVRSTLGPCGANVIISNEYGTKITKDGVSVARAIKEAHESPIINIIQEVAEKTGEEAGDGTTSSTVFAQALIHYIYNNIGNEHNLLEIKKHLDSYKKQAVEILRGYTEECAEGSDNLLSVAKISCNGDDEISKLAVEIVNKTGLEGVVSLKESDTSNTYIQYTEGLKWESGFLSQAFITSPIKLECELSNVRVEIYDDKLTSLKPLVKTMEICKQEGIPLLIAVKDIEYDVLNTIIYNQIQGNLKCCVIKIPGHGTYRKDYIDDLKSVIGKVELIDKVIVKKNSTLFINTRGNEESKAERIASLRTRLTLPEENIKDLQSRITNINNGFATVYVGGDSIIEIKEKIDRFEDAICAVKSAIEEGIVVGGGNTLLAIANKLKSEGNSEESQIAYRAIKSACCSIMEQILANREGIENYSYGSISLGIDLKNGLQVKKEGIVDPAKVIRLVIENGVSVAGTLITTKCLIIKE
nr:MAG TPA: GroEL [Caudoviricetes sp.]